MRTRPERFISSLVCLMIFLAIVGLGCRPAPRKQVTVVDGVEVIANPARPLHRNPGRVLKIEEKMKIRDTGEGFYFKMPAHPEIAADGTILLMDWAQLLRFSPDGAFLGNLIKPGQGPGEIERHMGYLVEGDTVYVVDGAANKVVHMTLDGRYLDDRKLIDSCDVLTRSWFVGLLSVLPGKRGVLADMTHRFFCTSRPDGAIRKTYTFLGKAFVKPPIFFFWDIPHWAADAARDLLFVSLSRDYAIKVLDLDAGRVVRSFSRAYPKVPYVVPENAKAVYARGGVPSPDFEQDVLELFLPDDSLWVRTSTIDARKGQLFDVFSAAGDFLDSFFVPIKDKILGVRRDTLFVQETAEDGTISIVLYRNLEYRPD